MDPTLSAKPRARAQGFSLGAVTLLFIFVVASQLHDGIDSASLIRAALFSVPLVLPLHGLIRGNRHTYRWATLCVLPYFVISLAEAFANPNARFWGTALLGASLLWFFSLIAFLRVTEPSKASSTPL